MSDKYEVTLFNDGRYYKIQLDEKSYYDLELHSNDAGYLNNLIATATRLEDPEHFFEDEMTAKLTGIVDGETGQFIDLVVSDAEIVIEENYTQSSSNNSALKPLHDRDKNNIGSTDTTSKRVSKPKITKNHNSTCSSKNVRDTGEMINQSDSGMVDDTVNTSSAPTINCSTSTQRVAKDAVKTAKETPKRKMKVKLNTIFEGELLDEAEAFLLGLIFERPLLFDYQIPICERNPISIASAWDDVRDHMQTFIRERVDDDSKITVDVLKDTWLNLRTTYMRYKSNTKTSTGSSPKKVPEIKHIELLRNYDSVAEKRRTFSSLDDDDDVDECIPPKKRGGVNDDFLKVAKKVLESVSNRLDKPKDPPSTAPAAPTISSNARLFAESIIPDLDLLNSEHLTSAKMRIAQIIFDELSKQKKE